MCTNFKILFITSGPSWSKQLKHHGKNRTLELFFRLLFMLYRLSNKLQQNIVVSVLLMIDREWRTRIIVRRIGTMSEVKKWPRIPLDKPVKLDWAMSLANFRTGEQIHKRFSLTRQGQVQKEIRGFKGKLFDIWTININHFPSHEIHRTLKTVFREIGQGSYGKIWLARDDVRSRQVAIKVESASNNRSQFRVISVKGFPSELNSEFKFRKG